MQHPAKRFLDRTMTRRSFVSTVAQMGVASGAAAQLAGTLSAQSSVDGPVAPGREVRDMTGGEIMAEFLLEWDVPYVFGLGGSEEVGFLDALVDRVALQYVQGLHEASVMSMADGYARASGRTAFMNVHSVAGTAHALGPMVNAFKDRIPIVIAAGRQDTRIRGHNAFLEAVNLDKLPQDYTRWTWDLLAPETIPEVMRRAFLLAHLPPGGPTFLTVSKNLFEHRVPRAEIVPRSRSTVESTLRPDPAQVSDIVDRLLAAQLPVLVAGRELNRYGGGDVVREIAELIAAPVFSDLFASHSPITFQTTHPLYGGFFAEDPTYPLGYDLFWSVGGTMFGVGAPPKAPVVPRSTQVVHTAIDATELGRNYPVDVAVMANPRLVLDQVLGELRSRSLPSLVIADRRRSIEAYTSARRQKLERAAEEAWGSRPISNQRLCTELNRQLDPDAILVTELITEEQMAGAYLGLNPDGGGRRMLTTSGGCLGWGLGAAIGAKIGRPEKQVVALVGDGSLQFGVQALWTASRYEVPVAIINWNNNAYQANRKFLHLYGGRAAETGKYVGCSLDSPEIDYVALGKAYSIEAERVDDPDELGAALRRCFAATASGRPYMLDVRIRRAWGGADLTWYDFFSVGRGIARQT